MNNSKEPDSVCFTGPLFLIGMPRSGTKLLRGLLNEHPGIGIPSFETEFFPYWIAHWQEFGDLSVKANFMQFYSGMLKVPYFNYCVLEGKLIDGNAWFEGCHFFTPAGVFEALVRHDAGAKFATNKIWGDKSPSYIAYLPLLKQQFPEAKFVHIIRDVRDYCMSIHYAWRKNMVRAAQRWTDDVEEARQAAQAFPADYMELRYEDLLNDPESELKRICVFLDLPYDERMLHLTKATENIGATIGEKAVVRTNQKKYEKGMSLVLRNKIEAIAGSTLGSLGYPVGTHAGSRRVSPAKMLFYKSQDGFNLLWTTIKRIGLVETAKYVYGALIISRK